jgi:hypothetical protein
MKVVLERRLERARAEARSISDQAWITARNDKLSAQLLAVKEAADNRIYRAATKLCALGRGKLGRMEAAELRSMHWAATVFQRWTRGARGRRVAREARWKLLRVVPSLYALKIMRLRSKEVERAGTWIELFDPATNSFWYYDNGDMTNGLPNSCWDHPPVFNDSMVCVWKPTDYPHISTCSTNQPCCQRFNNRREYNAHRIEAHTWTCAGCEMILPGLYYPKCWVCGNTRSGQGEDLESAMKAEHKKAVFRLNHPELFEDDEDDEDKENDEDSLETEESSQYGLAGGLPQLGPDAGLEKFEEEKKARAEEERRRKQRKASGMAELPQLVDYDPHGANAMGMQMASIDSDFVGGAEDNDVFPEPQATLKTDIEVIKKEVMRGIRVDQWLRCCSKYKNGKCTLTTCPRAHPGMRDNAQLFPVEGKGKRGVFMVQVCWDWLAKGKCLDGLNCTKYHSYVRPSTQEIVMRMYPKRNGMRQIESRSGMLTSGHVTNEIFQGYGIIEWNNGDAYCGNITDNLREGYGIWTSADGSKCYQGEWHRGQRTGWGVLEHPLGERYVGQFNNGKMEGCGELTSSNGDVYSGNFLKGKYEGLGRFQKSNGDLFMGYSGAGEANGIGVQIFASGEKYKGYFEKNKRNGKGVCIYPNKSKYSGKWVDGFHEGFGMYVTAFNAVYVGLWRRGKKHGAGRYYFPNGDFYDGEWFQNHGQGHGVYYHRDSQNVYVGAWEGSKRCGVGTYYFKNGSTYKGYFKDNDIHGKGLFKYAVGSVYAGTFKHNLKHGTGSFTWPNGNKYMGEFVKDKMEGNGAMNYAAGHTYDGQWSDNKKNGRGVFTSNRGNIYDGFFRDDVKHGKGKMRYYPNTILEESYDGDWKENKRHGLGKYVYKQSEGTVYEGEWVKDLRHGKGIVRFKDGSIYSGDIKKERIDGEGTWIYKDGSQYTGAFRNGLRSGYGTHLNGANGEIFQGEFTNGLRNGKGKLTEISGNSFTGIFDHGVVRGRGTYELHCTDDDADVISLKVFGF